MLDKPYIYNSNADFDNVIYFDRKEKNSSQMGYVNNKNTGQLLVHCRKQMLLYLSVRRNNKYMVL